MKNFRNTSESSADPLKPSPLLSASTQLLVQVISDLCC